MTREQAATSAQLAADRTQRPHFACAIVMPNGGGLNWYLSTMPDRAALSWMRFTPREGTAHQAKAAATQTHKGHTR